VIEGQRSNFDGSGMGQNQEEQKTKKPAQKQQLGGGLVQKKAANLAGIGGKKRGAIDAVIDEDEDAFKEGEDSDEEENRLRKEKIAYNKKMQSENQPRTGKAAQMSEEEYEQYLQKQRKDQERQEQ